MPQGDIGLTRIARRAGKYPATAVATVNANAAAAMAESVEDSSTIHCVAFIGLFVSQGRDRIDADRATGWDQAAERSGQSQDT